MSREKITNYIFGIKPEKLKKPSIDLESIKDIDIDEISLITGKKAGKNTKRFHWYSGKEKGLDLAVAVVGIDTVRWYTEQLIKIKKALGNNSHDRDIKIVKSMVNKIKMSKKRYKNED